SLFMCTYLFFFFFQAEDGIRDFHVTGVQTCALPIYKDPALCLREVRRCRTSSRHRHEIGRRSDGHWPHIPGEPAESAALHGNGRSEERRVGKECRSRWEAYH